MNNNKSEQQKANSKQEKLKMLGELVSGITHEINTPMHYLENNLTFLKFAFKDLLELDDQYRQLIKLTQSGKSISEQELKDLEAAENKADIDYLRKEISQALDQSVEGISMVSKLVLALKDFSHPALHSYSLIDVNKCVDTACTISRHEWKRVADIKLNLDRDLPYLYSSRDELHQILLNLIVNAAQAIGSKIKNGDYDRGNITITTKIIEDKIRIEVEDDGPGIPDDIKDKVFQKNFTTKEAGVGTGFGLSLVKKIVEEEYKGKVTFNSDVKSGTTFSVTLPHRKNEKNN